MLRKLVVTTTRSPSQKLAPECKVFQRAFRVFTYAEFRTSGITCKLKMLDDPSILERNLKLHLLTMKWLPIMHLLLLGFVLVKVLFLQR